MMRTMSPPDAHLSTARRVLASRLADEGHRWPEYAAALVVARGERSMSPGDLAGALDVPVSAVVGLESGADAPWSAPGVVRGFLASLPSRRDRLRGCLLGGAVGDALGAPVEFSPSPVSLAPRFGAITDDTQMTLFTAEGLLRSWPGDDPLPSIAASYRRWLATQSGPGSLRTASADEGWLSAQRFLWARRAPGTTCLTALETGVPVAGSTGCGGVMRVAPIGLVGLSVGEAFSLGERSAAVTHGHATGTLPAGVLAALVTQLAEGVALRDAVDAAVDQLVQRRRHGETLRAVRSALSSASAGGPPTRAAVEALGEGWVAEEALSIALYCALASGGDVRTALAAAVLHGGDSDSTGSICGQLLGAELGVDAIPHGWRAVVEGRDVVTAVADDLADGGASHPERWWPAGS